MVMLEGRGGVLCVVAVSIYWLYQYGNACMLLCVVGVSTGHTDLGWVLCVVAVSTGNTSMVMSGVLLCVVACLYWLYQCDNAWVLLCVVAGCTGYTSVIMPGCYCVW